ncbi:MAG: hypothetical protein QW734_01125 [Candidatus Bathyarchaeia archaeon]
MPNRLRGLFERAELGSPEMLMQLAGMMLAPPSPTYYPTNDLASLLRALAFGVLWRQASRAQAAQQFRDLLLQADPMRLEILLSDPNFRERLRRAGIDDKTIQRISEIAQLQRQFIEGIAQRIGAGGQTQPAQTTTTATGTQTPIVPEGEPTSPPPPPIGYTYTPPAPNLLDLVPEALGPLFGSPLGLGGILDFGRRYPLTTPPFVPSQTFPFPTGTTGSLLGGLLSSLGNLFKF